MIIDRFSYPPLWIRPNTFETLVLTILEQQVSLASAYTAYKKLKTRIKITPHNFLRLSDEELRNCYLSRQKISYTKELAKAILNRNVELKEFEHLPDDTVRKELKKLKGIGDWTVDIYLLHALRRTNIFPTGDIALINAIKMVKEKSTLTNEDLVMMSEGWKPYCSIATMLLWHYYIIKRNIKILH
ncbi:MAG: DNA-3-methyladenine glycosylase 2 family protein [Chitinophagaceae bacterium]|nr:DNA-3-methyladenine glycosylase 2 family protein [Chitinophagaceae bacterium]